MLAHIFAHLAMIHGFIPPAWLPDANGAFLGPAWSISTEWQFYLLAPLAVGAARKLPGLALVCAGVVASQVFFSKLRLGTAVDSYNGAFLGFYIQYFFVGGLSYVAWRVVRRSISNAGPAARPLQGVVLCGAGLAFFLLAPVIFGLIRGVSLTPFLPSAILGLWVFFFSCLCQIMIAPACLEARLVEKIGCSRVAMFLGRISYSIYLVHFPLGVLLVRLSRPIWGIPRPAYVIFFLIAGTLMTYACAAVLYHYVEAPAIAWAKKRFGEK
jgi:peptidoglycan/LPS O-acetylase OafA/YrhL